jgi:hypothetical protein
MWNHETHDLWPINWCTCECHINWCTCECHINWCTCETDPASVKDSEHSKKPPEAPSHKDYVSFGKETSEHNPETSKAPPISQEASPINSPPSSPRARPLQGKESEYKSSQSHTQNAVFICPYCKYETNVESQYQRHVVLRHQGKPGYPNKAAGVS